MESVEKSVGYARTSTKDQNINTQIVQLKNKGITPEQIFFDEGVSGSVPAVQRPGFKKLLKYIESHDMNTIYLFEISRLGRTFIDTLNLIMEFEDKGVRVVSLSPSEAWSTAGDPHYRKLLISIFGWVAENEKRIMKERIKVGIERHRKEKKTWGRPTKEPNRKEVMKYRDKGLTWSEISRVMNIPASTLYKYRDIWEEQDRVERVEKASE
ncbi:recombinase family protein [Methanococcoides alaskense]|uniref:DNA invertase Pin-like site-specific DNA recombinase n=1 Tax=Methanococcoides alaskense TaxID=325778 RepID=A0AA90TXJ0_9EURY|nr:recombinase family protein [Methanococcoides alaskense]MDA0525448.1 recombinase family protein [Methanococcoides alaskense]MDR6221619.1 DNA invertase Pin-like site-specific DNA recombinase [Methanococcoides alaskense]